MNTPKMQKPFGLGSKVENILYCIGATALLATLAIIYQSPKKKFKGFTII